MFAYHLAWFTLRKGHSVLSRVVAFSYMILSIIVGNAFSDYQAKSYQTQTAMSESISQDNAPQTATNHQKIGIKTLSLNQLIQLVRMNQTILIRVHILLDSRMPFVRQKTI